MSQVTKNMVIDLIEYMNQHNKKKMLVEEYIEETKNEKNWTGERKHTLYKSIHETKALFMDYCLASRSDKEPRKLYMRVSLI
ncbi:hypothetical protein SFC81_01490 [Enterococcus faecalis]|nr:hypothetical protein [Enterococcus faecalis]